MFIINNFTPFWKIYSFDSLLVRYCEEFSISQRKVGPRVKARTFLPISWRTNNLAVPYLSITPFFYTRFVATV